jgi:hypothetical protein
MDNTQHIKKLQNHSQILKLKLDNKNTRNVIDCLQIRQKKYVVKRQELSINGDVSIFEWRVCWENTMYLVYIYIYIYIYMM